MNEREAIKELNVYVSDEHKLTLSSECVELARKALEKQDARKVIYHDNCGNKTPYQPRCPRCYEAISEPYYMNGESWCPYCGQHIDWTVEE